MPCCESEKHIPSSHAYAVSLLYRLIAANISLAGLSNL